MLPKVLEHFLQGPHMHNEELAETSVRPLENMIKIKKRKKKKKKRKKIKVVWPYVSKVFRFSKDNSPGHSEWKKRG